MEPIIGPEQRGPGRAGPERIHTHAHARTRARTRTHAHARTHTPRGQVSWAVWDALTGAAPGAPPPVERLSPLALPKAVKNDAERRGMRSARPGPARPACGPARALSLSRADNLLAGGRAGGRAEGADRRAGGRARESDEGARARERGSEGGIEGARARGRGSVRRGE